MVVSQINVVLYVKRYLWPIEKWGAMEWLQLATAETIVLLVQATFFVYLNACVLIGTLSIVQLIVIRGQLKKQGSLLMNAERKLQLLQQRQKGKRQQIFSLRLLFDRFLCRSVTCLKMVSGSFNDFLSRALSAYIWINCPLSCVLTGLLLIIGDKFDTAFLFFSYAFLVQQWIGNFGIHLLVSGVNGLVHKPVKMVMHLLGSPGNIFQNRPSEKARPNRSKKYEKEGRSKEVNKNFRLLLKLSDYVGAYHVHSEDRYGFSYWGFASLVTMMSFSEFVLLYTQVLIYSYKWFTADEFLGFELELKFSVKL